MMLPNNYSHFLIYFDLWFAIINCPQIPEMDACFNINQSRVIEYFETTRKHGCFIKDPELIRK